jgi:hypothetical protein
MKKTAVRFGVAILSIPILMTLTTCGSSDKDVFEPCVDECDFEGQKRCMSDTHYRECQVDTNGCLVWDCST